MRFRTLSRIAVIHSGFGWEGGAEAVAVWTLEALKEIYDLTLIAFNEMPYDKVNEFYGTNLAPSDYSIVYIPMPTGLMNIRSFWHIKQHLAMRYCKSVADKYDLCISTYYEMDFCHKGIQYVHSPAFATAIVPGLEQFLSEGQRSYFKRLYRKLCVRLSGYSVDKIKQNTTLVNSDWTGNLIKRAYGIETYTVYPPVATEFPHIPWDDKEKGFICIGRLVPIKRVDMLIRILSCVREAGLDIHLHVIAGKIWNSSYYNKIKQMQEKNSSWVILEGRLGREQLLNLVARHKYGIHGMQNEHFGIAVAEMVKAGNIVFVPSGGGQVEIVYDERLIYNSEREAIDKIIAVLLDEGIQSSIRQHLATRSRLFSKAQFIKQMREVISHELSR